MALQPPIKTIRVNNIVSCLTPAVALLNQLNDGFGTPFVTAIANTTVSLITAVQVGFL